DPVLLTNELGEFRGRVCVAPMRPGNLEVHWPEGEGLMERGRRPPRGGSPGVKRNGRGREDRGAGARHGVSASRSATVLTLTSSTGSRSEGWPLVGPPVRSPHPREPGSASQAW